jgi:nanoRNase/pAp phosphatase (c-di-AMP/oligoRNAs hydrolase)
LSSGSGPRRVGVEELARLFLDSDDFLFTTHLTPDGDGLGSELALMRALRRRGKKVRIMNCSGVPEDLRFLTRSGEVITFQKDRHVDEVIEAAHVVAFDLGGAVRLGRMEGPVRAAEGTRILIDHHLYDGDIFDLSLVLPKASSSAEITYDLLKAMKEPMTRELAEPLYVGVVQDTGSFNYNSTSPKTHLMAAEFLNAGVDPYRIWKKLNCQKPFGRVKLMGENVARIRVEEEGRLASVKVDLAFLKERGGEVRDAFEVVNHFLTIKGVEMGVLGLQIASDKTKFSMRATGPHDVAKIASEFGGGGHRYAAGCTMDGMGIDVAFATMMDRARAAVKRAPRERS